MSSFEVKVDNAAAALKTQMVNICSNPVLMFNFTPSIQGVAYIDLTREEDTVKMPLFKGNIAPAQKIDIDHSDIIPDNSSVREEPWTRVARSTHTGSGSVAPHPLTSALQSVSIPREHSFSLALNPKG